MEKLQNIKKEKKAGEWYEKEKRLLATGTFI